MDRDPGRVRGLDSDECRPFAGIHRRDAVRAAVLASERQLPSASTTLGVRTVVFRRLTRVVPDENAPRDEAGTGRRSQRRRRTRRPGDRHERGGTPVRPRPARVHPTACQVASTSPSAWRARRRRRKRAPACAWKGARRHEGRMVNNGRQLPDLRAGSQADRGAAAQLFAPKRSRAAGTSARWLQRPALLEDKCGTSARPSRGDALGVAAGARGGGTTGAESCACARATARAHRSVLEHGVDLNRRPNGGRHFWSGQPNHATMRTLTTITAIFLPINLVTGLRHNFEGLPINSRTGSVP